MHRLLPLSLALLLAACGDGEPLTPPDARLPDGARYRGAVVDGLLQGQGRLDYPNGSWLSGRFVNGQLNGPGEWRDPKGGHYQGEFVEGEFSGQGHLTYADGSEYVGAFKHGRMHGEGRLSQGELSYSGGFRNDRFHGYGTLELADGSRHQGQFVRGEATGQGVLVDGDGNQFSGLFKRGRLNGEGSFVGSDGSRYSGQFKDQRFHGQGRYESAEGDVWSGQFRHGELRGQGEFRSADGEHYVGELRNWQYHGQGDLRLTDGSRYKGQFAHGQYQGEGRLTLADGQVEAGHWHNGVRLRDADGQSLADPLEQGILRQGQLLQEALAAVPASTPASELYSLTLAGDGQQSVFLREADYVSRLLRERFGARGNITLINHREQFARRPLASRESLRQAIQTLAERSGNEDLIFLYLTSHGSRDHQLVLEQPGLELNNLPAAELAELLKPLRERHKVLVISACFSGGFIAPLQDDKTLIMTAARADRVSFGCSEENDFTYFGRALFEQALQQTDNLGEAFALAKRYVSEREKAEDFEASEPQLADAPAVQKAWNTLRQQQRAALAQNSRQESAP